jgi:crotonobetainyl-CoA:carnitine CoA-transferase CaiB-like acyl-CoA transferase
MADALLSVNEFAAAVWSGHELSLDQPPATVASPVFPTAEGHQITVGGDPIVRDNFFGWCRAMGREDLMEEPRFASHAGRAEHRHEIMSLFAAWVAGFSDLDDLGKRLEAGGLSYGIVRTLDEIGSSEWALARGTVAEVSDRGSGVMRIPNSPWRFSGAESGVRGVAAYRGEHNRDVFGDLLGLSAEELEGLEARGVLSARGPRQQEKPSQG